MKKKIKKAFTLVELLVVIAILAILATVSIVGYNSFTKKAKVSNDTVLVKQMNDILFANKQTDDANPTMSKALEDVFDGGYDLDKLTPTTNNYNIVWDSKNDQMVLLDESMNAVYPSDVDMTNKYNYFVMVSSEDEMTTGNKTGFSYYLKDGFNSDGEIETSTGIDVGRNENIKTISYKNSNKQDAIIRTNSGTLTVDASNDNVYHYGLADKVIIENVYKESYHENGYVTSYIEVKNGHVVLEKNSSVSIIAINGTTVSVDQNANSELFKVVPVGNNEIKNVNVIDKNVISKTSVDTTTLGKMKYGGGTGDTETTAFELHTASHLAAFAKDVNNGIFTDYVYAKLCENVDISGMGWEPIGNAEHPFVGSFDGGENTISGLTNKGYSPSESLFGISSNSKNYGTAYGLFGVIGSKSGSTSNELIFKKLTLSNVNIDIDYSNMLGALIGADTKATKNAQGNSINEGLSEKISIENISVNGKIISKSGASVGGIAGKLYSTGMVKLDNCTFAGTMNLSNDANANSGTDIKAGGVVGFRQKATIEITNCNVNATVTISSTGNNANVYYGGLVCNHSAASTIKNNSIFGKIDLSTNEGNSITVGLYVEDCNHNGHSKQIEDNTYDLSEYKVNDANVLSDLISENVYYKTYKK